MLNECCQLKTRHIPRPELLKYVTCNYCRLAEKHAKQPSTNAAALYIKQMSASLTVRWSAILLVKYQGSFYGAWRALPALWIKNFSTAYPSHPIMRTESRKWGHVEKSTQTVLCPYYVCSTQFPRNFLILSVKT